MLIPSCRRVVKGKIFRYFSKRYMGSNPTSKYHQRRHLTTFCVLKKWVHSRIGQYVRAAVYTITPEIMASQPSNFLYSIAPSISRSSSKISRIRSKFSDFRQATSWLSTDFSMKNEVPRIFSKNTASNAVFHADSESELSLLRISFQTWDIQHRTCKNDRFRHRVPLVDSFSLPCPR